MKLKLIKASIKLSLIFLLSMSSGKVMADNFSFEFYNSTFNFELEASSNIEFSAQLSSLVIESFYNKLKQSNYQSVLNTLMTYKVEHQLNDWIYYKTNPVTKERKKALHLRKGLFS